MRFLVDAQLPPALVGWLVARGHEAEHVGDRQLQTASDAAIWDYALATSAVIVTQGRGFREAQGVDSGGAGGGLDQAAEHAAPRPADMVRYGNVTDFGCARTR
jgi:hypothetical protein